MSRLLLALIVLLAACSTKTYRKGVVEEAKVQRTIRPGMTLDEIRAAGIEVANCRGNPNNPSVCEINFEKGFHPVEEGVTGLIALATYPYSVSNSPDDSPERPSRYFLYFENRRLVLWRKDG